MKKHTIMLAAAVWLLTPCGLQAQTSATALRIELKDGTTATFQLSDKPELSFAGDTLRIVSSDTEACWPLADVAEYTFVDMTDGIGAALADGLVFRRQSGDEIMLEGVRSGNATLHDIQGRLMLTVAPIDGTVRLSLHALPTGIYIINANHQNIKIVKK